MADDRIDVKVGASTGELKTGMDQAKSTVQQGVAGLQSSFDQMRQNVTTGMQQMHSNIQGTVSKVTSTITNIGTVVVGLGAILAGGALFKGVVDKFVEMNSEAKRLSGQMGVSIQEAAAFIAANNRLGVSTETVSNQMRMFEKNSRANADALVAMGAKVGVTIDLNEGLETSYLKTIEALGKYKEGHDRNQAAMDAFGGRVQITNAQLRLNKEAVEEADKHLKSLGLTFDDNSGAKARAFKEGLHDVNLVFDALKYKIGEALIPELIKLGQWFSENGPAMIQGTVAAINQVRAILIGAGAGFQELMIIMQAGWTASIAVAKGFYQALGQLLQGNYQAASNLYEDGLNRAVLATRKAAADIKSLEFTTKWKIDVIFSSSGGKYGPAGYGTEGDDTGGTPKPSGATHNPKTGGAGGGGTNQVQVWKQELEEMKLAEKQFLESTLQDEMKFWKDKLALCREGSKEYTAVQHEVLILSKQLARQEYQEKIADIKAQMADERKNSQERIALQDQVLKESAKANGKDSVDYKNHLKEKNAMLLQFKNEQRQLEIADIQHQQSIYKIDQEMAKADLNFKTQMGKMNEAQKIQGLKRIEQAEHLADKQALLAERAKYKESEKEFQQYTKRIELLDKKHLADMKKMDQDYTLALKTQFDQLWSNLTSTFTTALQGMANGTMTFGQAVSSMFTSLGQTIISMIADVAMKYIANQLMMLIFGKAADEEGAGSSVGASAAEAGAAGFASVMAALPFPANVALAPEVGFAAAAEAMGFLSLASAAGGWDVPHDTLAMVHKDEKILPADWPEKLRAVAAPAGQAAGPTHLVAKIPITVVTPDGRTILKENKTMFFDLTNQGISRGEIRIPAPARR